MKLEEQVTSHDLSKKLKELGVKQDAIWKWYTSKDGNESILSNGSKLLSEHIYDFTETANAFTTDEIGYRLPRMCSVGFKVYELEITHPSEKQWSITYKSSNNEWLHTTSWHFEVEARGLMLHWLIKNGFIKMK